LPWKNECRIITRAVIRDKRNRLTTLEPKGEESGYVGFAHDITNEQSVPGLKITPKATILSRISELGKPYAFPLWVMTSQEEMMVQTGEEAAKSKSQVVMACIRTQ